MIEHFVMIAELEPEIRFKITHLITPVRNPASESRAKSSQDII